MTCQVVVETPPEESLLLKILTDLSHDAYQIVTAGSPSRCVPIAQAILALEQQPVAIVANSNGNSQQRETIEHALLAAPQTAPTKVIIVTPHLLMLMLKLPGKLKSLACREPTTDELPFILDAPLLVQKWLDSLGRPSLQQQLPDLLHNLSIEDLNAIRSNSAIGELREFVMQVAGCAHSGRTQPATVG